MSVRVRFAPNPSGELHLGSARTALFNWLFARHHSGTFVLRIEDTDPATARPEYIEPILEGLRWLGLEWAEGYDVGGPYGPYRQSERRQLHLETLHRLVESGRVYPCWCTRAEIAARGTKTGYDRWCRNLPDEHRAELEASDKPFALRFTVPLEREVVVPDAIRGDVRTRGEEIQDFVVARSDGSPTFVLANASDDIAMRITHAIRGEDLLSAAVQTTLIYEALGERPPAYAHLPLILDTDRSKLSKRKMATGVHSFRAAGYLSEAMVNYLALLGWSSPTLDEMLSRDRLVREFDLDRVQPHGAVFDRKKLDWMNAEHIKRLSADDLEARVLELHPEVPRDVLRTVIDMELIQTRVVTLSEVPHAIRYLHERPDVEQTAAERWLGTADARTTLRTVADRLETLDPWTVDRIRECVQGTVSDLGLHRRRGPKPIFVAISGSEVALPLFESIWFIGREESVARLRAGAEV